MSRATKRKHVQMEVLQDDFALPQASEEIVKVLSSRGNNLHQVESSEGATYLVSMPTKFRRNVWVKRGDYILVTPITEGDKVKAEMVRLLTSEHIKWFRKSGAWPEAFNTKVNGDDNEQDEELFVNTNRQGACEDENESSDDEDKSSSSSSSSNEYNIN